MASGILWQLVDLLSKHSLSSSCESEITNIFKMFGALGKGSQLMLAMWAASHSEQVQQLSVLKEGVMENGEQVPTAGDQRNVRIRDTVWAKSGVGLGGSRVKHHRPLSGSAGEIHKIRD